MLETELQCQYIHNSVAFSNIGECKVIIICRHYGSHKLIFNSRLSF